MACCVAIVYVFSLCWRGIRGIWNLMRRLIGRPAPERPVAQFAPVARRVVEPTVQPYREGAARTQAAPSR